MSHPTALLFRYTLLAADVAAELERRGVETHWLSPNTLTVAEFDRACEEVAPAFVFGINYSPEVAWLSARQNLPYVSWTIDPLQRERSTLTPGTRVDRALAFVHRRANVVPFREAGLASEVHFLPLAAAEHRRALAPDPAQDEALRCDASFAGNSLADDGRQCARTLESMGAGPTERARWDAWIRGVYQAHRLDWRYQGLDAQAPDAGLGGAPLETLAPQRLRPQALADELNGRLSQLLRADLVRTAARALEAAGLRFSLFGDAGWQAAGPECYRGVADHREALTRLYAQSSVNLDIPRIYQRDIVTLRVFDVLGCGGLVLTEPSADLGELFEAERHLVTYRGPDELARKLVELARSPLLRRDLAEAGRAHVEAHHRLRHRVDSMVEVLRRRGFWRGAS